MTGYNDPAFGFSETDYFDEQPIGSTSYPGLTKREYFAALAMQGLLASEIGETFPNPTHLSLVAVRTADALIAALNGEGQADG